MVPLVNRTSRAIEALAIAVAAHQGIADAVAWGLAQVPARIVAAVVAQDEFTHDVILPAGDGLLLVYDTT
jgi:hypothetical protein